MSWCQIFHCSQINIKGILLRCSETLSLFHFFTLTPAVLIVERLNWSVERQPFLSKLKYWLSCDGLPHPAEKAVVEKNTGNKAKRWKRWNHPAVSARRSLLTLLSQKITCDKCLRLWQSFSIISDSSSQDYFGKLLLWSKIVTWTLQQVGFRSTPGEQRLHHQVLTSFSTPLEFKTFWH